MGEPESGIRYYELTPLQQKILYAEKHKKDYGIYFSVHYADKWNAEEVERSIALVMNTTEAFHGRIVRQGAKYVFAVDRQQQEYRSPVPLREKRLQIFDGGLLAGYYIHEEEQRIEFLMHHLILDGDSLYLFLEYLEKALLHGGPLTLVEESYFQEKRSLVLPTRSSAGYLEEIKQWVRPVTATLQLDKPVYGAGSLSVEAYDAVQSLARKLKVTRFGVVLLAAALLSHQQECLIGIVVSRKNQRDQAGVIGNFTDLVPLLLRIDERKSYMDNAIIVFKALFAAIEHSASLTYEEYMDLLGVQGYDFVLSYTKMIDIERRSAVFSRLELGEYLYKYNNHLQFNEHEERIAWESCHDQPAMQQMIGEGLEEKLLELDHSDLFRIVGAGLRDTELRNECAVAAVIEPQARENRPAGNWFPNLDEDENLFDSSISSMEIAHMITDVYENLGVQLSYQDIYGSGTLRELKQLILAKVGYEAPIGNVREEQLQYQCPNFMKVIFIDSFRFLNSNMYDVKYAYRLTGIAEERLEWLKESIEEVIQNNDAFCTEFVYKSGEVTGTIQRGRRATIESITVHALNYLYQLKGEFRFLGEQKLWDIRLIRVQATGETYLYMNMHHLLIDHVGIGILLSQIEDSFHNRSISYAQYVQIASSYDTAKIEAQQGWQQLLPYNVYPNQGKPCLSKGSYHLHEISFAAVDAPYHETESWLLTAITNSLAQVFGETQGYIGAVYHGRVVPNASKVIHSLARVLPIFFDTLNGQVLEESLHTAHRHQAVSIYDLNEKGFSLEFPKVVFQTLAASNNEGTLFDRTIEFEGVSKFQIMFNLQMDTDGCLLSMYIDHQIYSQSEEEGLVEGVRTAVHKRQYIGGEPSYA